MNPHDPRGLRDDAPLLDAWLTHRDRVARGEYHPWTVPGHHMRSDLVGSVIEGDAPLYGALADIKKADALIAEGEARAATLWGADWCRFSVGGATHGNQAMLLAAAEPGRPIVVTRTMHRSALLGLVLAGVHPVWVRPEIDPATGLPGGVPVAAVAKALAEHPQACGVFLGDPSYVGTIGDLPGHAAAAHAAGVPLLVDAAWAAHLGFHPDLPPHALAAGADAMVTSAHKALPAYTQAALVLARTDLPHPGRLDPDRLHRAFEATHTTSPSGTMLASIDAARALLARDGAALCERLLDVVAQARRRVRAIPGADVLDGANVEPTKLVILLAGTGAHGHAVEADLIARGMPVEMADRDTVVPIVTMADGPEVIEAFLWELADSIERHRGSPRRPVAASSWTVAPQTVMSPREAFFARHETVPGARAVGRVSAELIAPYPPGIPVLAPGEVVTAEAVEALRASLADGGRIAYAADPTLATFQVVADTPASPEGR